MIVVVGLVLFTSLLVQGRIPNGLRVFHCNIGNLDESGSMFGPCPGGEPYKGGLCSLRQEESLGDRIEALNPHIVTLVEIVSAKQCAKNNSWCPSTVGSNSSDASCCGKNVLLQSEQILRILDPSRGWYVSCDTNDGHACIGVRSGGNVSVSLDGCNTRGVICNSTTPDAPDVDSCKFLDPPADLRSDVSWVNLKINGESIRYVVSHPWAEDVGKPRYVLSLFSFSLSYI